MVDVAKKDMRDAFFDEIYAFGFNDNNVFILTDDADVFSLRKFKSEFPDRFINAGVAEQNMVNVAAGLASVGKKVFIYGISAFVIFRCFEQLKFSVCSMNLPVVIVGVGTGFSFEYDGPTHHATHDIPVMRSLPEIDVFNPSDTISASKIARLSYKNPSPMYVRIDKGSVPTLYGDVHDFSEGLSIIKDGNTTLLISTGVMSGTAVKIAKELEYFKCSYMDAHGRIGEDFVSRDIAVLDIYRLKPINESKLVNIMQDFKSVVVIEENSVDGSLGTSIGDIIAKNRLSCKFAKFGVVNEHCFEYGSRDFLHKKYKIDYASLVLSVAQCSI